MTCDSGKEWIDSGDMATSREKVAEKIAKISSAIRSWDDANPVVRVVLVRIEEVEGK
jgi:hypothetical protein